jgi:hypothetical protein
MKDSKPSTSSSEILSPVAKRKFKPTIPPDMRVRGTVQPGREVPRFAVPQWPNRGRSSPQSERRLGAQQAFQPRPKLIQVYFTLNCNLLLS